MIFIILVESTNYVQCNCLISKQLEPLMYSRIYKMHSKMQICAIACIFVKLCRDL